MLMMRIKGSFYFALFHDLHEPHSLALHIVGLGLQHEVAPFSVVTTLCLPMATSLTGRSELWWMCCIDANVKDHLDS